MPDRPEDNYGSYFRRLLERQRAEVEPLYNPPRSFSTPATKQLRPGVRVRDEFAIALPASWRTGAVVAPLWDSLGQSSNHQESSIARNLGAAEQFYPRRHTPHGMQLGTWWTAKVDIDNIPPTQVCCGLVSDLKSIGPRHLLVIREFPDPSTTLVSEISDEVGEQVAVCFADRTQVAKIVRAEKLQLVVTSLSTEETADWELEVPIVHVAAVE
jgi:hypothetical protein